MPSNLPPELLALLQGNSVGNTGSYMGDQYGSSHYAPIYGAGQMSGGGAEGGDWQQGPLTGYYGTENGEGKKWSDQYNGKDRNEYDAQGNYVKTDQWSGLSGGQEMLPLMMMLGPLAMQAMGAGFAGVGAGAGGSAAGTAAELALAGEGAFGATNALGGAGAFGPAGSAYYAGTGALGAAGGTGFGTLPAVEVPTWSAAEFAGSQPFSYSAAGGAAGGAAGASGAGGGAGGGGAFQPPNPWATAATTGGGAASLLGSASGLVGPAAALLGAASGAEGTPGKETTQTKDLPEWLKPSVEKMLGYGNTLLDKQMAPGYLAGYDTMREKGLGLLNTPQLGNAFNKFFPQFKF